MRLYDPDTGRVGFDGVDLRELELESLYQRISVVPQEPFLLDGTIRENIVGAEVDSSDAKITTAAERAQLDGLVREMPDGYDTPVGEAGGALSGGQRQRVALARALSRTPDLLILDEVTSALDPASEASINATIDALAGELTVVSVTHRLGSVRNGRWMSPTMGSASRPSPMVITSVRSRCCTTPLAPPTPSPRPIACA